MTQGKSFSERDRGRILAYVDQGLSYRQIAKKICSNSKYGHKAVANFVKNQQNYGKQKRHGPKSRIFPRTKRRIWRAASNSTKSSKQIKNDLGLDIAASTIRKIINNSGWIKQAKMKKAPRFKKNDKPERLRFAHQNMNKDWIPVFPFLIFLLVSNFYNLGGFH